MRRLIFGGRVRIRDVSDQRGPLGMVVPPSVLAFCVVRAPTGSPGLVCRESTGLASTAFTHDPSRWCHPRAPRRPRCLARLPGTVGRHGSLTGGLRTGCGLWADDIAANSTVVAARQSGPEACRMGSHDLLRGRHRSSRGALGWPKILRRRIVSKAPRTVIAGGLQAGDGDMFGSTWNTGGRSIS